MQAIEDYEMVIEEQKGHIQVNHLIHFIVAVVYVTCDV